MVLNISKPKTQYIVTTIIITLFFILLYSKLLFSFNEFIAFGNFFPAFSISVAKENYFFFNPYSNFGSYSSFPLGNLEFYTLSWTMQIIPGYFLGFLSGIKFFILISSVIYGTSFFFFTSIFTKRYLGRLIGTIFFLFNPFTLQLYAQGDFYQLVFYSFVLVGSVFLHRAIETRKFFHPYFVVSSFFVVLSFVLQQLLIAALLFYLVIMIYSNIFAVLNLTKREKFLNLLKTLIAVYLSIIFIGMVFILPVLFSPSSFLPGSINSLTLGAYIGSGLNLFQVLTLKAYYPYLAWIIVQNSYGALSYNVWVYLEITIIIVLLFGFFITLKKQVLFFAIIALIITPFAAETHGIFLNFDIFLFNNLPGFQAINYPYLWVWFILMPIYSIIASLIFSEIYFSFGNRKLCLPLIFKGQKRQHMFPSFKKTSLILRRTAVFFLLVISIIVMLMPILTQEYYGNYDNGNTGIRQMDIPNWEYNLDNLLVNLTKDNNSGVLFNDNNIMQSYSQFKTPIISNYIPDYSVTSNFFGWLYKLLNNNETTYSANILSIMGVQYFVFFKNVSANGNQYYVPPSSFSDQIGWAPIVKEANFTIYKNQYYSSNTLYSSNYILTLGNYNMLNELSYLGINLSRSPIFFSTDINNTNYRQILNNTKMVVLSNRNEITGLELSISNSTLIYPVDYLGGQYGNSAEHWINSERVENFPFSGALTPFAETTGKNNLTLPINLGHSGNYQLFFKVAFTNRSISQGGELKIILNDHILGIINTSKPFQNSNNRFMWVNFTANLLKEDRITFQSLQGLNAISQIRVISNNNLSDASKIVSNFLSRMRGNVIEYFNPGQLGIENCDRVNYGVNIGALIPGGEYLYINSTNSIVNLSFKTIPNFTGSLYFRTLSLSNSTTNIFYSQHNISLSYLNSTSLYETIGYYSFLLKINNISSFNIVSKDGIDSIGTLALIGSNVSVFPSDVIKMTSYKYEVYKNNSISNLTLHKYTYANYTILKGNFSYKKVKNGVPLTLDIPLNLRQGYNPVYNIQVGGPGKFYINGISIQSYDKNNTPFFIENSSNYKQLNSLQIEFVPKIYDSMSERNISFNFTFYGVTYFPANMVHFNQVYIPGSNISNYLTGYFVHLSLNKTLIIHSPLLAGSISNYKLGSLVNGLNIFVLPNNNVNENANVYITSYSFKLFMDGIFISTLYPIIYILIYIFSSRKKH